MEYMGSIKVEFSISTNIDAETEGASVAQVTSDYRLSE